MFKNLLNIKIKWNNLFCPSKIPFNTGFLHAKSRISFSK